MAMSKRDYVAIAAAVKSTRSPAPWVATTGIVSQREHDATNAACAELAGKLATYLATSNPRFDRQRFLEACGVVEA